MTDLLDRINQLYDENVLLRQEAHEQFMRAARAPTVLMYPPLSPREADLVDARRDALSAQRTCEEQREAKVKAERMLLETQTKLENLESILEGTREELYSTQENYKSAVKESKFWHDIANTATAAHTKLGSRLQTMREELTKMVKLLSWSSPAIARIQEILDTDAKNV